MSDAKKEQSKEKTEKPEKKVDLGLLEEDDEFEEFPADEWTGNDEEEDQDDNIWEDNWEDDNVEDDFSQQLRTQLQQLKGAEPMQQ